MCPSHFFVSKVKSCLNPEPCSGNCPSPLSWLAFAHNTVTLVLTGIYRWGKRAVTHTHTHTHTQTHTDTHTHTPKPITNAHTNLSLSLQTCTLTHRCTRKGRLCAYMHISLWFSMCVCVCVCVCVCECERWGLHFPEAAVSGSVGVDSEQAPLGQGTLIFMSAQGNGITLFSVSYCACVRVCVHAW